MFEDLDLTALSALLLEQADTLLSEGSITAQQAADVRREIQAGGVKKLVDLLLEDHK